MNGYARTVALSCHQCQAYVNVTGWDYDDPHDPAVHVLPSAWAAHRSEVHGVEVPVDGLGAVVELGPGWWP